MNNRELIEKLKKERVLSKDEFTQLISTYIDVDRKLAAKLARAEADRVFGKKIFVRGLIEFSSYCKNDCFYCGLRRSNSNAERYRLSKEEILNCCDEGYELGFRTFVLQSGEDSYYTDEILCDIVNSIKTAHSDCAVTLSLGERNEESYKRLFDSGADRYLLRHETANAEHYAKLHPKSLKAEHRQECLRTLKRIGYQTGCGFMVGSPYQTAENLAEDMLFIKKLDPEMVGIGPFIPQHDTPFRDEQKGSLEDTLFMLSLIRLMKPNVLLPATTALGTISDNGREQGILVGANVVMPNLSPTEVRSKYLLYDNKICTGDESAQCKVCLNNRMKSIGYEIVTDRGDYKELITNDN